MKISVGGFRLFQSGNGWGGLGEATRGGLAAGGGVGEYRRVLIQILI